MKVSTSEFGDSLLFSLKIAFFFKEKYYDLGLNFGICKKNNCEITTQQIISHCLLSAC